MHAGDAIAANREAISRLREGDIQGALTNFRSGVERFPRDLTLRQNLAQTLYQSGDTPAAIAEHRSVLHIDAASVASHLALYEMLQIVGEREAALDHQRKALARQQLFSSVAPRQARSVLIFLAPGDFQANIPVDFLFDRTTTTVHKLYLVDAELARTQVLPPHDVAWNAIAESQEAIPYLALAELMLGSQPKPRLNAPGRVLTTSRILLPHTLSQTAATVPPIAEMAKDAVAGGSVPFAFPVIVRPVDSHAGLGLEKIESSRELAAYTERNPAARYNVSPFVDYRSSDGLFRKYRIVFVDGEPYPVHLAISPNWMIHYYNAPMIEHQWMRDEEARFLRDLRDVFTGGAYQALLEIARDVQLEYFGIDCALTPEGKVLVFEADPAMLVHTSDPIDLFPYKHEYVPRIFSAVERMIDKRKSADT